MEIELPTFNAVQAETEVAQKEREAIAKAFGKVEVNVKYVGVVSDQGVGGEPYVLVELDENEELEGVKVDTTHIVGYSSLGT